MYRYPTTRSLASGLSAALFFALSSVAAAQSAKTAEDLSETVRILESGKVGNVEDFCPYLKKRLAEGRSQHSAESKRWQKSLDNPPKGDNPAGGITRGWAAHLARWKKELDATGRQLDSLERRIAKLCALGAAAPAADPDLAAGGRLVVTPIAFSGGRLSGTVVDDQGAPLAGAVVTVTESGTLQGVVESDGEGRFGLEPPAHRTELAFALAGLTAGAMTRVIAVGDEPLPETAAGTLIRLGDPIHRSGEISEASFTQAGSAFAAPVATAISADGRTALSTVVPPAGLEAGDAALSSTGSRGPEELGLSFFTIAEATLDQERLRSGERAEFGWTVDLGEGRRGARVQICAVAEGPVRLLERACQEPTADAAGRARYTSSVQARRVKGEVPFSLDPRIEVLDPGNGEDAAPEPELNRHDKRARELEDRAQRLEREAESKRTREPEAAARDRLAAAELRAQAEDKYRDAERLYRQRDRGELADQAKERAESSAGQRLIDRSLAANDYRGAARRHEGTSRGSKAAAEAAGIERALGDEARQRAMSAARDGGGAAAADEMRQAAEHYRRAQDDFGRAHKASERDGMQRQAEAADAAASRYDRSSEGR